MPLDAKTRQWDLEQNPIIRCINIHLQQNEWILTLSRNTHQFKLDLLAYKFRSCHSLLTNVFYETSDFQILLKFGIPDKGLLICIMFGECSFLCVKPPGSKFSWDGRVRNTVSGLTQPGFKFEPCQVTLGIVILTSQGLSFSSFKLQQCSDKDAITFAYEVQYVHSLGTQKPCISFLIYVMDIIIVPVRGVLWDLNK